MRQIGLSRMRWTVPVLHVALSVGCLSANEPKAKQATERTSAPKVVRITRSAKKQPVTFETAILRYEPKDGNDEGLVVDLIGAVHIGDPRYYQDLQAEFEKYDVLLYEFVAPKGSIPNKNAPPSGLARFQHAIKDLMDLSFQLDEIDYDEDNFVHADMSPNQFLEKMDERGETFFSLMTRAMRQSGAAMANSNKGPSDFALLFMMFSPNRSLLLKRAMSEQIEDIEMLVAAFDGPNGSTLIGDRNDVALKVLKRQIQEGKKRIGIFYGCGHLPDFDTKLKRDFDLKQTSQRWLVAWDMSEPVTPAQRKPQE